MPHTALELMGTAQVARREHRLADAQRDLVEAVSLCRRAWGGRDLVRALKALGQIERDLGHGEAARLLYEEAVALCRVDGDSLLLAHTLRHLGDIHLDSRRLTDAKSCYDEALTLYRTQTLANPLDVANAIRPLALLMDATGRRQDARPLWEEAQALYTAADVQAGIDECSARLAGAWRQEP